MINITIFLAHKIIQTSNRCKKKLISWYSMNAVSHNNSVWYYMVFQVIQY